MYGINQLNKVSLFLSVVGLNPSALSTGNFLPRHWPPIMRICPGLFVLWVFPDFFPFWDE
ncbi:hypothetical protein MGSAQ_001937 [marine sediment metagenome]|uniref:Uncharacterized protein n=1 Tax=marine sediment metagenome TaxID=412755 RepID=A0A1B6NTD9_9ZZZZ